MEQVALERSDMLKAYRIWAHVYDFLFSHWLQAGRILAVAKVCEKQPHSILDVGVGTGLALPLFPATCAVSGVDLSPDMLEKAKARVAKLGLSHVQALEAMDATHLSFVDGSFEALVAEYMLTLVPNAEDALNEFARVTKPGGRIVLVNYFCAEAGVVGWFDKLYGFMVRTLGLATDFPFSRIQNWLNGRTDVRLVETRAVGVFNLFTVVVMEKVGMPHGKF